MPLRVGASIPLLSESLIDRYGSIPGYGGSRKRSVTVGETRHLQSDQVMTITYRLCPASSSAACRIIASRERDANQRPRLMPRPCSQHPTAAILARFPVAQSREDQTRKQTSFLKATLRWLFIRQLSVAIAA